MISLSELIDPSADSRRQIRTGPHWWPRAAEVRFSPPATIWRSSCWHFWKLKAGPHGGTEASTSQMLSPLPGTASRRASSAAHAWTRLHLLQRPAHGINGVDGPILRGPIIKVTIHSGTRPREGRRDGARQPASRMLRNDHRVALGVNFS